MKHLQAEIITVGTELLLGFTLNTNAMTLSKELASIGLNLYKHHVIGDNKDRLKREILSSMKTSQCILITGGLGPTTDDITVEAVARALGQKLVFNQRVWKKIQKRYQDVGRRVNPVARKQAYVLKKAIIIKNQYGSAPGQIIHHNRKTVILLPGVPTEANQMMQLVKKYLVKKLRLKAVILSRDFFIVGLNEPQVETQISDLLKLSGTVTCGIYSNPEHVTLRVTAKAASKLQAQKKMQPIARRIKNCFGPSLYSVDSGRLEVVVGMLLKQKKKTVSIAESCTGGLIAHRLTNVPGSSQYLTSSVVAYSNKSKTSFLGVSKATIKRYGAVSKQCAIALAKGIRACTGSDLGLSVTGIAGPTGGSKTKPIGTVFIALVSRKTTICINDLFLGTREQIKTKSAQAALNLLRKVLLT